MQVWVFLLWGIASLMACWSFSLMVRWGSDWNARRRKRLTPMYSKRAFRLAPLLALVCISVAIIAGIAANQLASINGDSIGIFRSPVGFIGFLLSAFGTLWIIRILVGDRARGRVRCPKCWYDMSDVPGMMCPECGNESTSRSQHTRTKRPKLAFLIAGLSIGVGAYGLSVNRRVIATDLVAAVPTWTLMIGWEWLPTPWIYDDGSVKPNGDSVAIESCLQNRLSDEEWVSIERSARFARRLAKPMFASKDKRWDTKRLDLLATMYVGNQYWRPSTTPPPRGIDSAQLLRLCAIDITEALQAETLTLVDEIILNRARQHKDPYTFSRQWIFRSISSRTDISMVRYIADPVLRDQLEEALAPVYDQIDHPAIIELINDIDDNKRALAQNLMADSKAMNNHYQELANDLEVKIGKTIFWDHAYLYSMTAHGLPDDEWDEVHDAVAQWLQSDIANQRSFALQVINNWVRMNQLMHPEQTPIDLSELLVIVREHCLGDDRLGNGPRYPQSTIHVLAVNLILQIDPIGLEAFPLIGELLDQIKYPGAQANAFYAEGNWTDESFRVWLEEIGSHADSPNPEMIRFVLNHIPKRSDSIYEEQIIDLLIEMLDCGYERIVDDAVQELLDRGADIP